MKKSIFDRLVENFEDKYLKDTYLQRGRDRVIISSKLKLGLAWSVFVLVCIVFFLSIRGNADSSKKDKVKNTNEKTSTEALKNTVPYEKDAYEDLNAFLERYFMSITDCDNETLQAMVIDPAEYEDDEVLKKKTEFIIGYSNLTVYTKTGNQENTFVTFVVSNLDIAGVTSKPYDIVTLYIVKEDDGTYKIHNEVLDGQTQSYIAQVKADKDIQKVYQMIHEKNEEMKKKDKSLQEFYEILSRGNKEASKEENAE